MPEYAGIYRPNDRPKRPTSTYRPHRALTAYLIDPEPITQILAYIGEPTSPLLIDHSPAFDPTEPEPIPEDDFDQSWEA